MYEHAKLVGPFAIGVDVGGSHVACCAVDLASGCVVSGSEAERDVDPHQNAARIIDAWSATIGESIRGYGEPLCGIGVAMPGPFDYLRGISTISGVEKYENLFGLDVTGSLHASFGNAMSALSALPVRYTNDAAAFALGESLGGAARGIDRVVALTLGTGFGSGFIANGELISTGDEVPPNGWVYNLPFDTSIADDQFTTRWFVHRYRELTGRGVTGAREVAERVTADPAAAQIFEEYGRRLADFVLPLYRRFRGQVVVIGGNIARAFPLFSPSLERRLAELGEKIDFRQGNLWDKAAMTGAASLFK